MISKLDLLYKKIDSLSNLKQNWDGYKASPISEETIRHAKKSLRILLEKTEFIPPGAIPCSNEEIIFEWRPKEFPESIIISANRKRKYGLLLPNNKEYGSIGIEAVCQNISEYRNTLITN